MTAYSPTITSPLNKSSNAKNIEFTFNDSNPGATLAYVCVRRRQMYPSVGTYEYWNGSTGWTGTETWIAVVGTYRNNETYRILNCIMGSNDTKYQFSVAVKDSTGSQSPYATDRLVQFYAAFIAQIDAAALVPTVSRPMISWLVTGATYRIRDYRVVILPYMASPPVPLDPDNPPLTPVWDSGWVTDPGAWYTYPEVDLAPTTSYRMWVGVRDENGVSSDWVYSTVLVMNANPPPAPTLTMTPNPLLGRMEIYLNSSFNLLSVDNSTFEPTLGTWFAKKNATISRDTSVYYAGGASMKIVAGGASYGYLDTTYTDYTAEQTALATYTAETNAQEP